MTNSVRPSVQPTLGRRQFAVLLFLAILRVDELGGQGHNLGLFGRHNHRCYGSMPMQCLAVFQSLPCAMRAGKFLRGKKVGAVKCDEQRIADSAIRI